MDNISDWINLNELVLNITKSSYMIMSPATRNNFTNNCTLNINNHVLKCVNHTTFLWIILDDTLSWKLHINNICGKISRLCGIFLKARQVLYGQTLLLLYDSLVKPHVIYCIANWGNTYKTYMHKLHLMQKRILRIITNSEFHAHTALLFAKHNIMSIHELHEYFCISKH